MANDIEMLKLALEGGASARNVTSRYDGTALIAAAHLGHAEVVKILIAAKAPLNHVNNLGWTALMELIVLGNGGANHTATLKALVEAGADVNIADRQGITPLQHARRRGYVEMARILEANGGALARTPLGAPIQPAREHPTRKGPLRRHLRGRKMTGSTGDYGG